MISVLIVDNIFVCNDLEILDLIDDIFIVDVMVIFENIFVMGIFDLLGSVMVFVDVNDLIGIFYIFVGV